MKSVEKPSNKRTGGINIISYRVKQIHKSFNLFLTFRTLINSCQVFIQRIVDFQTPGSPAESAGGDEVKQRRWKETNRNLPLTCRSTPLTCRSTPLVVLIQHTKPSIRLHDNLPLAYCTQWDGDPRLPDVIS